jgi:putative oxidoreductase
MKIAATIARYLMGLIFLVFGLNKFFNFIPSPPLPGGVPGEFMHAFLVTKYAMLVGTFEVVGALFLLANRFVPLALAFLAPVIVNILFVNATMAQQGLPASLLRSAGSWFTSACAASLRRSSSRPSRSRRRRLFLGYLQHLAHKVVLRKEVDIVLHCRKGLIVLLGLDELADQRLLKAPVKGLHAHCLFAVRYRLGEMILPGQCIGEQ